MMSVRRLRPYLFTNFAKTIRHASQAATNDYQQRVEHLERSRPREEWYPRIGDVVKASKRRVTEVEQECEALEPGSTTQEDLSVIGRIQSIRSAGSKLAFVTIREGEDTIQVVLKNDRLGDRLKSFMSSARRGDTYAFEGWRQRSEKGQARLEAIAAPKLLSPSLHQIPEKLLDTETLSHQRHVHMLVDPDVRRVLRVRHAVEHGIEDYLTGHDFVKVSTPILQAGAGGAIARPFETQATEMADKKLHLRIAPELWLKRLVVGGLPRVFEIGPVFRNEGVDATHNPEFTMCEFYAAHATLSDLMAMTEELLQSVDRATKELQSAVVSRGQQASQTSLPDFQGPFAQLEFIPSIEAKLGRALPDLSSDDAYDELTTIFNEHKLSIPSKPSMARLLDALAGHLIEPDCDKPTFITHHPAVLSPLAKCFKCGKTGQLVSARAELFVNHCEIANMYEEQNSPFEQRKAFEDQLAQRAVDGEGDSKEIDHAYVETLEWGLPPTGGWGCGVDRLVMLFSGKSKLGDVLSFGGLRNVVGVSRGRF